MNDSTLKSAKNLIHEIAFECIDIVETLGIVAKEKYPKNQDVIDEVINSCREAIELYYELNQGDDNADETPTPNS